MNKKIFLLLWMQLCLFAMQSSAQLCFNTGFFNPTCILDQHVNHGSTYWYPASQGGLAISPLNFSSNNAPNSTGNSIELWGFEGKGNGAYTCYNFKKDSTYKVCFWVRNNSGVPTNCWGKLKVYAADFQFTSGTGSWAFFDEQFIDSSYYGPPQYLLTGQTHPWKFVSATFTADADFNALWLYAYNPMGLPPPGPMWLGWPPLYVVEVDDIRVSPIPSVPYNVSVTGNNTVLNGCNGQAQLFVNGMPPNSKATWNPAPLTQNADGSVVTVKPCNTTVYEIIVTDTLDSCATCLRKILHDTIIVDPWLDTANLVYDKTVIPCGGWIDLNYNDPGTCPFPSYTWIDPQGTLYPGKTHTGTIKADAIHTGEWTLQITKPSGCVEELKFPITVGSCCISSPDFIFTPNSNPVLFNYTGSGITNHKATLWNFGDGTTSDLTNPVHTYNVTIPTTFTVCLTTLYEDAQGEGCCNRICKPVRVRPNPNTCVVFADFGYTPVSGWGNTFDFTDLSSGSGTICSYKWDFGDGNVITTNAPTIQHQYTMAGTSGPWWVCLEVVNCVYDASGAVTKTCTATKCMWERRQLFIKPG